MNKSVLVALVSTAALLSAGAAHAGGVSWSVGFDGPGVETVISNGPIYRSAPRVYVSPPVIYVPAPVYVAPPVVYQQAPPVYYAPPAPTVVQVVSPFYRPVPMVAYPRYWVEQGRWQERDHDHGHRHGWDRSHDGRWDEGRHFRD